MTSYVAPISNKLQLANGGIQSMALIPSHKVSIKLPIVLSDLQDLTNKLLAISKNLPANTYEIYYAPSTNNIIVEGKCDCSDIVEQINQLAVRGTLVDRLDISNFENHARMLYYKNVMKANVKQIDKCIHEISLHAEVMIKDLTYQVLPKENKGVKHSLTSEFIEKFTKISLKIIHPYTVYYLLYNEVVFLLANQQLCLVGGKNSNIKLFFHKLECTLLPNKTFASIRQSEEQKQQHSEIQYPLSKNIQDSYQPSYFPNEDHSINIVDSNLNNLSQIGKSRMTKLSSVSKPMYNSIRVSTTVSNDMRALINELSKEKPKVYYDEEDLTIEYRLPVNEEIRLYCYVSKHYLNIEMRKRQRQCCVKLYKKFEWSDKEGQMKGLEENERTILNLELEKTLMLKRYFNFQQRKIGNSVFRPEITYKKQKAIHEYINNVKVNSYSRLTNPNIPGKNYKVYLFGTNKSIGSAENYISNLYNSRKNKTRGIYLNKFIPIMENQELKTRLYMEYMVKVLGIRITDNCIVLLGIRIRNALDQICSEYEAYDIHEYQEDPLYQSKCNSTYTHSYQQISPSKEANANAGKQLAEPIPKINESKSNQSIQKSLNNINLSSVSQEISNIQQNPSQLVQAGLKLHLENQNKYQVSSNLKHNTDNIIKLSQESTITPGAPEISKAFHLTTQMIYPKSIQELSSNYQSYNISTQADIKTSKPGAKEFKESTITPNSLEGSTLPLKPTTPQGTPTISTKTEIIPSNTAFISGNAKLVATNISENSTKPSSHADKKAKNEKCENPKSITSEPHKPKRFGLDIKIYNKMDWREHYRVMIGSNKCLCFPLHLPEGDVSTIGQIKINVASFKKVENVEACMEFPSNIMAYIDKNKILVKDESYAELAIMFD